MTYATQQDLIDRFGNDELLQLADRDGNSILDAEIIAKALSDADTLIDSHVGVRYDLPLVSTPALLNQLASDIARYRLYKDGATEQVNDRYKDALRQLRAIAAGTAVLDIAGDQPTAAGAVVKSSGPARIFTDKTLGEFIP